MSASLYITSFPDGAEIFIDGVDTGDVTPAKEHLNDGSHVVMIVPGSGWQSHTQTVSVSDGQNFVNFILLPVLTAGPQGPQGAPGPAGSGGAAGPTGPTGPTNIFHTFFANGAATTLVPGQFVDVIMLSIPEEAQSASYLVIAELSLGNSSSEAGLVQCRLNDDSTSEVFITVGPATLQTGTGATIATQVPVTIYTVANTLAVAKLSCFLNGPDALNINTILTRLSAIRTNNLTMIPQ